MKALDTMPHEHLLHKISRLEIKYQLCSWITSFFSNMSQCIMINGCKSESVPVTNAMLQNVTKGSVLKYSNCVWSPSLRKHVEII